MSLIPMYLLESTAELKTAPTSTLCLRSTLRSETEETLSQEHNIAGAANLRSELW